MLTPKEKLMLAADWAIAYVHAGRSFSNEEHLSEMAMNYVEALERRALSRYSGNGEMVIHRPDGSQQVVKTKLIGR
jgi:hypothetical protein